MASRQDHPDQEPDIDRKQKTGTSGRLRFAGSGVKSSSVERDRYKSLVGPAPAYAGSHGCPSSAVACYGGWIKPWGSTARCILTFPTPVVCLARPPSDCFAIDFPRRDLARTSTVLKLKISLILCARSASTATHAPSELARYSLFRAAWFGPSPRASREHILIVRPRRANGAYHAALTTLPLTDQ